MIMIQELYNIYQLLLIKVSITSYINTIYQLLRHNYLLKQLLRNNY